MGPSAHTDDRAPRTLAILPALNEEASIAAVIADLREHQPAIDVLVVDDGSTDATARIARMHGAVVVQLPFNLGVGAALRTGFRYAREHGYDRALQFDSDGQHRASEAHLLFAELDRGADLVVGSRFRREAEHERYSVGRTRGTAMAILRTVLLALTGRKVTDTSSGFRAFSRPMLEHFSRNYPREYLSDTVEALVIASYGGFCISEVGVQMRERTGGQASTRHVMLAFNYLRVMLVLMTRVSLRGRRLRRVIG